MSGQNERLFGSVSDIGVGIDWKGDNVLEVLERTVSSTRCFVNHFDPSGLSGLEARAAVEAFVELEKLAASGRLLAAGRLDQSGVGSGDTLHPDLEGWLANLSGTSVGAARGAVSTARRVAKLPKTAAALRAGELSAVQADAITAAAKIDPGAERALLETAKTSGVRGLKIECDRVRAAAADRATESENYERIHNARSLRHRTLADGTGVIDIRGPADRTAQIMAGLEPIERELFEANRTAKNIIHPEAVAFDAMVALTEHHTRTNQSHRDSENCTNPSEARSDNDSATPTRTNPKTRGTRPLAMIVVHVSHAAYQRGWTQRGEICEIEGTGPIPVSVAYRLASDSILKAVVIDGTDVTIVSHLGRTIPTHLRTAIETRDRACVIAGCDIGRHLEIDHNIPVATRGPTSLENLARICYRHHDLKTRGDLRRTGPLGQQQLVTRDQYTPTGPAP